MRTGGNVFSLLLHSFSELCCASEHPEERLVLGWRQVCVSPQSRCHHQEVVPLGQTGDLLVVAGGRVTSLGERIWPHYTYGINTEISHSQLQL